MRIGEASKRSGVPVSTIRYYIRRGLIVPDGEGTQYLFDEQDCHTLEMCSPERYTAAPAACFERFSMQRHVHGPLSPIKGYLLIRDISSVLSFYDCFSNPVADPSASGCVFRRFRSFQNEYKSNPLPGNFTIFPAKKINKILKNGRNV